MILHWTKREEPLRLQWRGPNRLTNKVFSTLQEVETKLAVIMGPRGRDGKDAVVTETQPLPEPTPVVSDTFVEGNVINPDGTTSEGVADGGFF